MRSDDLDYSLPPHLIATEPAQPRDAARLMVIERATQSIRHAHVRDLATLGLLRRGDLLILNRTRVLPAYFQGRRAQTRGRVRGLYLGQTSPRDWTVMLETRGKPTPGQIIILDDRASLKLEENLGQGQWRVAVQGDDQGLTLLNRIGKTPLPPYIRKARRLASRSEITEHDALSYNTVFARDQGSLAAPTAGLHFTPELLHTLADQGIHRAELTLHVGIGTFAPIRSHTLQAHHMHSESIHIPAATIDAIKRTRAAGRRIIPVGTTCVRAIESLPHPLDPHQGDYTAHTNLFIHPEADFTFRFTDALLTNFHLPRSTLLALVATLPNVGLDRLKACYAAAIEHHYRFYSYGDAMLIL